MKFNSSAAEIFIPDGENKKAFSRQQICVLQRIERY